MTHPSDNVVNGVIAGISGIPGVFAMTIEPTTLVLISSIGMPLVLFFIGKTIDVVVRIYLDRRKK